MSDLKLALKILIVQSCEKDCDPAGIADDEPLFGSDARLALDSLDALQLSMALQKRYGIRLTDSKETRRILANVESLAGWLYQRTGVRGQKTDDRGQ
ncbi:MAG: phosphopantetheine-binding protein [Zoogloeaceae bacterium]|jgi:acyl carrier protein|nr:phosphopantetheine-binding protein [Zoogloeaceae bacterium]